MRFEAARGCGISDAAADLGFTSGAAASHTEGAGNGDVDVTVYSATGGGSSVDNTELVAQFNELLTQIDELSADASYNGVNLINSTSSELKVALNEYRDSNKSELVISGQDLTSSGLSLTSATALDDTEADNQLDDLSDALDTLRSAASEFGSNLSVVEIRENFTNDMINTLQTGADNLVLADTNEEGANLLALQTRQSLASTALSLSSQADQNVLRLF